MTPKELIRRGELFPAFFDDFFRPWNDWPGLGKSITTPAVNIVENKNHFEVSVAAPGLKKSDFNISVEDNMLTISCEKEEKKEDRDERYTRKEYSYTSFSRSFTLPEEVIKDKIEAVYDDGVLRITLPKTEVAKKTGLTKQISVK
ncbi:Hsp20/alpha crystallin family protein [Flavihumibacter solisilvae]|uniref:Heat-shock protein Hsp20 n=1 Tax=Flavihumibacter solisilvae TaxID=1349421 RepID=A0A0C1LE61_9BACT|nr:Hsp20/alpha crystallin family protein [Flavihumibacter solisilvae]KIC93733.1 heat-shock protein Hsp20 [Flavihumibacter solisilvae]